MIANAKKTAPTRFPKAKIADAVRTLLPTGDFKIHVADSRIGKMKIVRVVTPAWKSLRPAERIGKILDALSDKLTARERENILRFSVLTPAEYDTVVKNSPVSSTRLSVSASTAKPLKRKRVARKAA